MEEQITKRAKIVGRVAAVLVGVLGLYIIWWPIRALLRLDSGSTLGNIFGMILFSVPVILFAGYCFFVAYKIWTVTSAGTVRKISLIAALVICFIIIGSFYDFIRTTKWQFIMTPLIMIVGGICYLVCYKVLVWWMGLREEIDWVKREKRIKTFFTWLIFLSWTEAIQLFMEMTKKKGWPEDNDGVPWDIIFFLVSVILAFMVYKICVRIALYGKPKIVNVNSTAVQTEKG